MGLVEKLTASMFLLIFLYLIVKNADAVNNTINSIANVVDAQVKALQGR